MLSRDKRLVCLCGALALGISVDAALGQTPTLEEIVRASEEALLSLRAGKVRFRMWHVDTAGKVRERTIERHRRSLAEGRGKTEAWAATQPEAVKQQMEAQHREHLSRAEEDATLSFLLLYGDDDVVMCFDLERNTIRVVRETRLDRGALISRYGLGERGRNNLPLQETSVREGDTIVSHRVYAGDRESVSIYSSGGCRVPGEELLESGLLTRKRRAELYDYGHQVKLVGEMVELTFTKGDQPELVFLLDPSLGLRITEERRLWRKGIARRRTYSYTTFGETLFLRKYVESNYDPDGHVVDQRIYEVEEVSLAGILSPEEFLMALPSGAPIRDQVSRQRFRLPTDPVGESGTVRLSVADVKAVLSTEPIERVRVRRLDLKR